MKDSEMETLLALFRDAIKILESIPPRERKKINEAEVVFMDNINGRVVHNRAYTFFETVQAISDGGTPIGLLLMSYADPEKVESKILPTAPEEAQELLAHAQAEAEDEARSQMLTSEDEDE